MTFQLQPLPYSNDALEPHIDAKTMEIHHDKHHAAYTNNLNNAIAGTEWENKTIEEILADVSKISPAVRNNAGGFYNHNLFWEVMAPNAGGKPTGDLMDAIDSELGGWDKFKETFSAAATTRFGSGWAWLMVGADKKLVVNSTPNQDNALMDVAEVKGTPILGIDVWEHAYYLNYQNRRPDYIGAFYNVINWNVVSEKFKAATK